MLAPRSHRRGKTRRGWLIGLVAIVALIAAGPTIVATTPARDAALATILPPEVGTLTARGAALGWTGPTALTGVELRDPQGAVVFTAERVEVGSTLLELAAGGNAPLAIRLDRPVFDVQLRGPQGSNLEAIAAAYERSKNRPAGGPGGPAKPKRPITLSVVDGQARITDTLTGERWLASELSLSIDGVQAADPLNAIVLEATGKLVEFTDAGPAQGPAGDFALRVGPSDDGRRLAQLRVGSTPLSLAGALLRRGDPTASATGWLSAEGEAAWRVGAPGEAAGADPMRALLTRGLTTSGRASLVNPAYRGRLTGGEPLRLDSVEAPWSLVTEADRLRVDRLDVESEIGSSRVRGVVTPAELNAWLVGRFSPPGGLQLAADVDLARLGAIAPEVLRLRDGVEIRSGRVRADVTGGAAEDGAARLTGKIRTDSLEGVSGGRAIAWRDPLRATFAVRQTGDSWRVERLRCESEFLTAEATGDARRVEGSAEFDLDRLAGQLSQFVDLGQWRLAGRGRADARWAATDAQGGWRLEAKGSVLDLFVGDSRRPLAQEPRLEFDATVRGAIGAAGFAQSGMASLAAGEDRLEITVGDAQANAASRPVRLKLTGDLATWHRRARLAAPNLPAPESLRVGGRVAVNAEGATTDVGGALQDCRVAISNLEVDAIPSTGAPPTLAIREPKVELQGDLSWETASGLIRSTAGQVVASAVSLRSQNVSYSPVSPADSRGEFAFRGDAARIGAWFPPSPTGPRYQSSGAFSGTAAMSLGEKGVDLVADVKGNQLALVQIGPSGPAPVWSEPELTARLQATVQSIPAAGGQARRTAIDLRDLRLTSQTLAASASGRVEDVAAVSGVRLGGAIDYDLEKLSPLLWPKFGENIRFVGRDRATFQFTSDERVAPGGVESLRARIEAPWSGADLFGLPVGPGRLGATLADGVLRTDPLAVALGDGQLTTQAAATITPPAAVTLAPGPVVSNVAISTEVAERLLKYVAPVLADATRVDGRFSVSLSEFTAPLDDPGAARATGQVDIHAAQVMPGPAIEEWVALVRQIRGVVRDGVESVASSGERPLVSMNQTAIQFQMADRRVYHRGLAFNIGDAVVTSEGSVGVDETLDLMLSVPILDEWVARRPVLLGGLRGQAVRVPVRGTFSDPELDREAFRQLSRQLLQSAAQGAIDQGLNLLLERLKER